MRSISATAFALLLTTFGCRTPGDPVSAEDAWLFERGTPAVERRIAFHRAALTADPQLHPAWIELGHALLDRARVTKRAADVVEAERAIERGLALQPTFEGYVARAALANFRHRFDAALAALERAEAAWPGHLVVHAMRVEALVGRGALDDAEAALGDERDDEPFHRRAARGRVHVERERIDAGFEAYRRAAEDAETAGAAELATWAWVRAGATLLDAGRVDAARPCLERAQALVPEDRDLRFHQAELLGVQGRHRAALAIWETLLDEAPDPGVLAVASATARALGDPRAAPWFDAARTAYEQVVASGEGYAHGALARLLSEADRDLDEALQHARRHAELDRGRDAQELVRTLEARAGGAAPGN